MGKHRVTFEVDSGELFDTLKAMKGNFEPLGSRLVATLLTGKPDWADGVGMAAYGVIVIPEAALKSGAPDA